MNRITRTLALSLPLLLAATSARSGEIEITFDFTTATTVTAYGGQIKVPPQGSMFAGSGRLVVPGAWVIVASPGAARLENVSLGLTVNALTLGANVLGSLIANQTGMANGNLTAGLGKVNLTSPLALNATGGLDCGGNAAVCSMLGNFALVFSGSQTIAPPASLELLNVNVSGGAQLKGRLALSFSGATAVVDLVGTEVSRTFVPEPSAMAQLGAAILALGALARHRRLTRAN